MFALSQVYQQPLLNKRIVDKEMTHIILYAYVNACNSPSYTDEELNAFRF